MSNTYNNAFSTPNPTGINNAFSGQNQEIKQHSVMEDKGMLIGGGILVAALLLLAVSNFSGNSLKGSITGDAGTGDETLEIAESFRSGLSAPTATPVQTSESTIEQNQEEIDAFQAQMQLQQQSIIALQAQLAQAQQLATTTTQTQTEDINTVQLQQQIALQQQALQKLQASNPQKTSTTSTSTTQPQVIQPIYVDALNAGQTIEKISAIQRQASGTIGFIPSVPKIPVGIFPQAIKASASSEVSRGGTSTLELLR